MKKYIVASAAICIFSISAYAGDYDCDSRYQKLYVKAKSYSGTQISKADQNRYIIQLKKAYNLCKEGKEEQAEKIVVELEKEYEFLAVFEMEDGN